MTKFNEGLDPETIEDYRKKIKKSGKNYLVIDSEDNSDEYVNFYFVGVYEGKEVIFDAVIYTLRLHHESELYEIAEHKAANHFPKFKSIKYKEDENGDLMVLDDLEEEIGLYMAEVMMELEEEGEVKVQELLEIDTHADFGIGINVALNIDAVTSDVINKFIEDFNSGTLELDDTWYTFQVMDEDE